MRFGVIAVMVAFSFGCERSSLIGTAPFIEVEPLALDFGPVPVGLPVSLSVQVRNLGKSTLVLQPAVVDAADYSGPTQVFELEGGERRAVDIVFQPTVEGLRQGVVHLQSNAENAADVSIPVTGLGVPRLVCVECDMPPTSYCASTTTLINFQPHGVCVGNRCEYQASNVICSGTCEVDRCTGTQGTDAGVDAGMQVVDAGTDAGSPARFDGGDDLKIPGVWFWTVPPNVTQITIKAWGGGGAGGIQQGATGGGGAFGKGVFAVTPGETLEVRVAEGGISVGNGAGATSVWRSTQSLLVIAGGGGGGSVAILGAGHGSRGGAGGTLVGEDGQALLNQIPPFCLTATGGKGGGFNMGGAGGTTTGSSTSKCNGEPGRSLAGGNASWGTSGCNGGLGATDWRQGGGGSAGNGGGGGSGYFGGGGAGYIYQHCAGGGGGGSSNITGAISSSLMPGVQRTQGNDVESGGYGAGGLDGDGTTTGIYGKPGRVIITY